MHSLAVERALGIALEAHAGQYRKGGGAPYAIHPLHVAILLARWGLDEELIVAGLLHDVVEDCEGWTQERIEAEFGPHVAAIVAELTEDKTRSWEERKAAGIAKVAGMSPQAASVKAADQIHNLHSLGAELRRSDSPAAVWAGFHGGREGTLRVAREMVRALSGRVDPRLARGLRRALREVEEADREQRARVSDEV